MTEDVLGVDEVFARHDEWSLQIKGLGSSVQGAGFGVWSLGLGVWGTIRQLT